MFSINFYRKINYQLKRKANFKVFVNYFIDRLKHPFTQNQKKRYRNLHKEYLKNKKTTSGYFSINAYYWKVIINKYFKEFSYLEIGSWEGDSALFVLKNFSTKEVICVDVWDSDNNKIPTAENRMFGKENNEKNFKNFIFNLEEFKDQFTYFKERSDNFFEKNKKTFDIIYIDGAHDALQVNKDIRNAWDVLNLNGIMICDDYFFGLYSDLGDDVPATPINKFLIEKKNRLKILCVNNNQIFFKKILD